MDGRAARGSRPARALVEKTHRYIVKQPTFADAIVEGLLYLADHGRRDAFTRHLVASDDSAFSQRLAVALPHDTLTGEFWGQFRTAAQAAGDMNPTLDLDEVHHWLGNIGLMLMSLMDRDPNGKDRLRTMIRTFVVPALGGRPGGQNG